MRFDSAEFLAFFAVIFALHQVLAGRRTLLVFASYAFYASWNPPFLLLLLFSSVVDFTIGKAIEDSRSRRRRQALLWTSIGTNLGILAYFKYFNFFLDNTLAVTGADPALVQGFYLDTFIPLGISFYTFQTMSYSIDVYRGHVPACRSWTDFALFVTFFPQLIAGPILRAAEFLPQIRRNARAGRDDVLGGIELCFVGLLKKVVIADNLGVIVDRCYADPHAYSGAALLIATYAFWAQVFCDFDGYSTMARGLGRLLGYRLPINFLSPLLAGDPIEYRRRWHITMGAWFRDYVYRPLGGDRRGFRRMLINTMLVWAAFGLWHGASWTFVAWGAYNGVILAAYRTLVAYGWLPTSGSLSSLAGYLIMPVFGGTACVFFRAASLEQAGDIFGRILTLAPGTESIGAAWVVLLSGLYALHWLCHLHYREDLLVRVGWTARLAWVAGGLAVLMLFGRAGEPFIYFQF